MAAYPFSPTRKMQNPYFVSSAADNSNPLRLLAGTSKTTSFSAGL
jgi:hypothetical protein